MPGLPGPVVRYLDGSGPAAVCSRTDAGQDGNSYFFFPFLLFLSFLLFLLFLAMPLTSLPEPEGQRNVDQASTYH